MNAPLCPKDGKICHPKKSAAKRAIKQLQREGRCSRRYISNLYPYHCAWCSKWHIGHNNR